MPIYEYTCELCSHRLEAIQKFGDLPLQTCPACKGEGLKRLISAPAFHLKGSGWYATDFKNKPAQKTGDAEPKKTPESTNETSAEKPVTPAKTDEACASCSSKS